MSNGIDRQELLPGGRICDEPRRSVGRRLIWQAADHEPDPGLRRTRLRWHGPEGWYIVTLDKAGESATFRYGPVGHILQAEELLESRLEPPAGDDGEPPGVREAAEAEDPDPFNGVAPVMAVVREGLLHRLTTATLAWHDCIDRKGTTKRPEPTATGRRAPDSMMEAATRTDANAMSAIMVELKASVEAHMSWIND